MKTIRKELSISYEFIDEEGNQQKLDEIFDSIFSRVYEVTTFSGVVTTVSGDQPRYLGALS